MPTEALLGKKPTDYTSSPSYRLRDDDESGHGKRRDGRDGIHLARHDSLTGLPNRKTVQERTDRAIAAARRREGKVALLHFQPQIGVASGGVVGAEVLLRWQHPNAGMIAPGRFIPVAVNISAMQFIRSNLEATILLALEKSGLPPELLELELTESIFIHHAEQTLETVRQLKDRGIRIAIDDFGTGYSSLPYLKRFAANVIKIDRTFICNIANDADDVAIVRAVIQLAKSLGIATIAEGVEDHATVDLLGACRIMPFFPISSLNSKKLFSEY